MEQVGDVVMASNSHNQILMIRGKRTKRPRPSFPLSLTMACSSSSSVGEVIGRGFPDGATISSTTSSTGITDIPDSSCLLSEEEEDMANCLILLAQGSATFQKPSTSGLYAYRCMTCDKSFSSFQALGGHRASHKKPKPENTTTEGRKATWHFAGDKSEKDEEDRYLSFSSNTANTTLSLKMMTNNNRVSYSNNKVHECAICGAEFSSGQALGGHMRRHRSFTSTSSTNPKMTSATAGLGNNNIKTSITEEVQKKSNPRNSLGVDLNLPAPEESHPRESSPKKFLLLIPNNNDQSSTLCTRPPALVDCTY